jgi:uncharacterized protein (DUF4415 family)
MKIEFDQAKSKRKRPNPELIDEENPEWTEEMFRNARPAREVLPETFGPELAAELMKRKSGQRGAQRKPIKEPVTVRYSREVLDYFRSSGPGWQTRIDAALKEWVAQHPQNSEGQR